MCSVLVPKSEFSLRLTIGELAKQAGVNTQTIRYYERIQLLPAAHRWPGSGYPYREIAALAQHRDGINASLAEAGGGPRTATA